MRLRLLAVLGAGMVSACQPTVVVVNPIASVPREEVQAAAKNAETPAGISTLQFKELGDTKRYAIMARVIRDTWGESCKPTGVVPNGYSPNGASQWRVHCEYSTLAYDYVVALPERQDAKARALQCYPNGRMLTCSIVPRPAAT